MIGTPDRTTPTDTHNRPPRGYFKGPRQGSNSSAPVPKLPVGREVWKPPLGDFLQTSAADSPRLGWPQRDLGECEIRDGDYTVIVTAKGARRIVEAGSSLIRPQGIAHETQGC